MKSQTGTYVSSHNLDDMRYIEDLEIQVQELKLRLQEEQIYSQSLEREIQRGH